jgi:hypothetical protein
MSAMRGMIAVIWLGVGLALAVSLDNYNIIHGCKRLDGIDSAILIAMAPVVLVAAGTMLALDAPRNPNACKERP